MRILIIDDDESTIRSISRQLKDHDLECCMCPVEGVARAKKEDYDIIISDLRMRPLDGVEVVREIRDFNKKVRIIIMTGFSDCDRINDLEGLGVEEVLIKPIPKNKILKVIK